MLPANRTPQPDFVIIGAMKCATSTLHEQLAAQPGFYMSKPKEPNFFSNDEVYARGMDWYRELFAQAPPGALRGESSTHYTKLPTYPRTVPRLQGALGKELKLIYVMRQPVERLVSQYVHEWSEGIISVPLEQALERHPELVEYGCYARQLEPWLRAFGPQRILPVFVSSLNSRPQHELDRVGAFLGAPGPLRWNPELTMQNSSRERMRRPAWIGKLAALTPLHRIRQVLIPSSWRERVKRRWQMTERPELAPEHLAALEQRFDEDLARLGGWLSLPLNCRDFKRQTAEAEPRWSARAP